MGMGKTLVSLIVIKGLLELRKDDKVIVVVPAAVVSNWAAEVKKFFNIALPYIIGEVEEDVKCFASAPILNFIIISYEVQTFINFILFFLKISLKKLSRYCFFKWYQKFVLYAESFNSMGSTTAIVFDEAHLYISSNKTQLMKAIK